MPTTDEVAAAARRRFSVSDTTVTGPTPAARRRNGVAGATLRARVRRHHRDPGHDPGAIKRAADARTKAPLVPPDGRLMIIACDHPARGANGVGNRPLAMGNRIDLLERLQTALSRPGVDGLLGSPDIIEDLLLLGRAGGQGRVRVDEPRWPAGRGLRARRPVHRLRRPGHRRHGTQRRQDPDPGRAGRPRHAEHPDRHRHGDQRTRRARPGGDGRTVLVVPGGRQGAQRPVRRTP